MTDLFTFFCIQTNSATSTICWRCCLFHCMALGFFVKYQVYIGVWEFLRVLKSIPLITLSVSIQIPCSIYYYISVELLGIRDGDPFRSSFIIQECFSYLGRLFIQMKLRIALLRPQNKTVLKFWWGLHWIFRLLLVRWSASLR